MLSIGHLLSSPFELKRCTVRCERRRQPRRLKPGRLFTGRKADVQDRKMGLKRLGFGKRYAPTAAVEYQLLRMTTFKHAMAQKLVDVMVKLDFPTFTLIDHDRGGRRVQRKLCASHRTSLARI